MKQLCVHWIQEQGFKYHFQTPSAAHHQDTNWYYNDHSNRISDARTADELYSTLDDHMRYIGDDSDWNEINYINALSSFTLQNEENNDHHYFENFAKGSFKQCRHSLRMRECVTFHMPSKTLTVNVKIGRARKETQDIFDAKDVMPDNVYKIQTDTQKVNDYIRNNAAKEALYNAYEDKDEDHTANSAYDFHGEFEYGDSLGYDNWAKDVMKWRSFKCINCEHRRLLNMYEMMQSDYSSYGDFTYLFNEYELDYDNNLDWNEIAEQKDMKCSIAIPGFEHKLCVDMSAITPDKGAKISFAAADDHDINYGYYDMYGYDAYYYNLDHLYPHDGAKRRLMDDDDDMFGTNDYEVGYEAMEQFYDALNEEFISSLRNELSAVTLHFLDDNAWNDITTIYDTNNDKSIRKCASFQASRLCATHSLSNPNKALSLNLKIGKHKYHRSSAQKYSAHPYKANTNYMNIYQEDEDDDINTQKQQHWIINDGTFEVDDDEWNDPKVWTQQPKVTTSTLRKIVQQRCRHHTYCLCQYVDTSFDHSRKHPCARGKPQMPQKVVHVMDDFVKNPKAEFIPLPLHKSSPLKIEFHYKPHIQNLHVVGGLPFFHRRNHIKRYKVPWYKYARYEHIRPKTKPDWLPHWMWREIDSHTHLDPLKLADLMRDLKREGTVDNNGYALNPYTPNAQGVNPQPNVGHTHERTWEDEHKSQQLLSSVNKLFKQYQAHDVEGDTLNVEEKELEAFYYDYNAELEDELDAMHSDNNDASDAVHYMYPLMENAAKAVWPLFDAFHDMMGKTWAAVADKVGIRRRMENDDVYDDDDDDEEEVIDDWYDTQSGLNWVMINDALNEDDLTELDANGFEIDNDIIGSSGKSIQKKCMNVFAHQVCICQFLEIIGIADKKEDHLCYPQKNALRTKPHIKTSTHMKGFMDNKHKVPINSDIKVPINRMERKEAPKLNGNRMKYDTPQMNNDIQDLETQKQWIMNEANKIRSSVKSTLPQMRPVWFPHYFWHWLHSAPHFHILLHRKRVPWIATSSSKYYDGDRMYQEAHDIEYNYYQYGDMKQVSYEELEDELYDISDKQMYEYEYDDMEDADVYESKENEDKVSDYSAFGAMNVLANGDDFMGDTESMTDEIWRFETILLLLFVAVIFCFMASCFLWRSKWGELIRKLNKQRIERNKRLYEVKRMSGLMNEDDDESSSSSLCISDVFPVYDD